jgi:hypothetical protein
VEHWQQPERGCPYPTAERKTAKRYKHVTNWSSIKGDFYLADEYVLRGSAIPVTIRSGRFRSCGVDMHIGGREWLRGCASSMQAALAGIFLRRPFRALSREILPTFQREILLDRTVQFEYLLLPPRINNCYITIFSPTEESSNPRCGLKNFGCGILCVSCAAILSRLFGRTSHTFSLGHLRALLATCVVRLRDDAVSPPKIARNRLPADELGHAISTRGGTGGPCRLACRSGAALDALDAPTYRLVAPRPQRPPARRGAKEAPVRILPGLRLSHRRLPN